MRSGGDTREAGAQGPTKAPEVTSTRLRGAATGRRKVRWTLKRDLGRTVPTKMERGKAVNNKRQK